MPQVIINNTHLTFSEDTKIITLDMVRPYQNTVTHITIPEGVTTIGHFTFQGCTGLTSVTFPDGLTNIEACAFERCTGLTSVSFPDGLTTIGYGAFQGCTGLTHLTFPDGLTNIEACAFERCSGLTHVTFPDGLTFINANAFRGCTGLTHLILPDGLTTIGNNTFSGCTGLTSVTFPATARLTTIDYGAFQGCTGLTSVTFPATTRLTTIREGAFSGCTGLTSVTFPATARLTTIDYGAFQGCTGLTSVTFPATTRLTTIREGAFYGCSGLTHLILPDSLTTIESGAFGNCTNLQYILIPKPLEDQNPQYWQDKGIDPATRTIIISKTQLQAFAEEKSIDSHTNPHEIATLFLVDQGHIQLPQARDHLNIRQRITQLSLSNLFRLPIQKDLILPGFVKYQNLTIAGEIVSEALAPLGHWAVQAANPLTSWLSWHDIARIWVAKAKAPRKLCPPALQAAQIQKHKDTSNRHDKGYTIPFLLRSRGQHSHYHRPNHADPRTSCTKN